MALGIHSESALILMIMLHILGNRKSPRRASTRALYTSIPTALTQLEEENEDVGAPEQPNFISEIYGEASSSPKIENDRRRILFKEFFAAHKSPRKGHKSPGKRIGKVVRALLSPCSKSNLGHDDESNSLRPC